MVRFEQSNIGIVTDDAAAATLADARARSLGRMTLVCLAGIPWDSSWKRHQSMTDQLSRLAPFDRVVSVDPRPLWIRKELSNQDANFAERLQCVGESVPRSIDDRITTCRLTRVLPLKGRFNLSQRIEDFAFEVLIRILRGSRPFVLLNNHPNFFSRDLLLKLMEKASLCVYDLSDDFVEFYEEPHPRKVLLDSAEFSCRNSDLVLTVNEHVAQKYGPLNENTHVITNATNFQNFNRDRYEPVPELELLEATGKPMLGHTGTINRVRVDYELLESVVRARRQWNFVFVGMADPSFLELAARHENLHYFPRVRYERLPDYVRYFDVAIIPFRVNEHTRGNDLLKFNDYLAMGTSIVTTRMGGAFRYEELLSIADSPDDFLEKIEAALVPADEAMRLRRQAVAESNSWSRRASSVRDLFVDGIMNSRSRMSRS